MPSWWWIPLVAVLTACIVCLIAVGVAVMSRRRRRKEEAESAPPGDEMMSARADPPTEADLPLPINVPAIEPISHKSNYARVSAVKSEYVSTIDPSANYNYDYGGGVNMVVYSEAGAMQ